MHKENFTSNFSSIHFHLLRYNYHQIQSYYMDQVSGPQVKPFQVSNILVLLRQATTKLRRGPECLSRILSIVMTNNMTKKVTWEGGLFGFTFRSHKDLRGNLKQIPWRNAAC